MMKKRIFSIVASIVLILQIGIITNTNAQSGDFYCEDFESFSAQGLKKPDKSFYDIKDDETKCLSVLANGSEAMWTEVSALPAYDEAVLEFDVKNSGSAARVYASFGGGFREFFCMLNDGRGPIVRTPENAPIFFFANNESKPDKSSWNHVKIIIDNINHTLQISFNDNALSTLYDKSYSQLNTVKCEQKPLTAIRFGVDTSQKDGYALYDNIRYYENKTFSSGAEADADTQYNNNKTKLAYLGILPDEIKKLKASDNITRAQFTELSIKSINSSGTFVNESQFSDVSSDSEYFKYINEAVNMNAISKGEKFNPDNIISLKEAVKILVCLLGYDSEAKTKGGYATGYITIAKNKKMLDGINVKSELQLMNMHETVNLLCNFLDTPLKYVSSYGTSYEIKDSEETVMNAYHNMSSYNCYITDTDYRNKTIKYTYNNENKSSKVDENVPLYEIKDTMQTLYIKNDSDNICFMTPYKTYRVLWGYIKSYNDNKKNENAVNMSDIKKLQFSNLSGSISLDKDAVLYENNTLMTTNINLVNSFTRLVVFDDCIKRIDILKGIDSISLTYGGIIESKSSDTVRYTSGENSGCVLDVSEYDNVITVIDSKETGFASLNSSMVFDYCHLDENTVIISASSSKYVGKFESFNEDEMVLDNSFVGLGTVEIYKTSDKSNYELCEDLAEYLGSNITVYTDMAQRARYIVTGPDKKFYGVVMGIRKVDSFNMEYEIKIGRVDPGNLTEKVYLLNKDKCKFTDGISADVFLESYQKTDAGGVFYFDTDEDEINIVSKVSWISDIPEGVNDNFDYRAPRVKVGSNWHNIKNGNVLILKNLKNEFEPRVLEWSKLSNKLQSGVTVLIEDTKPVSELMVIVNGAESIYDDSAMYGFIVDKKLIYENGENYYKYAIIKGTSGKYEITVKEENELIFNNIPLEKYDYLWCYTGALFDENDNMKIRSILSLKNFDLQDCSSSDIVYKNIGCYLGQKQGFLKTSYNGEVLWNFLNPSGYEVYSYNSDRSEYTKAKITEAYQKNIGVIALGDIVRMIIFEQ